MKSSVFTLFLSLFVSLVFHTSLYAASYNIDDIRVLGLQRVSAGTVFSSINVKAKTQVSDNQLQDLIRDLFDTELFETVTVGIEDNTLIITVKERPVVYAIIIEGNKIIEKEPLLDGLKFIGLAEGEVFKQSALLAISKQLNSQYGSIGRYSAKIETLTRNLDQNQVIVGIRIDEGEVAKIKHINIVGNTQFDEDELREEFELNKTGTWSWITGNDKYAQEKLSGDLERLTSFYQDRGFLKFDVTSTQVSISPDKESVFITINVDEGIRYTVESIDIAGDPILPEEKILPLILIKPENTYSQLLVTLSEETIKKALGNEGYSAASISAIPEIDDEKKTVKLSFFIKPGSISYVRRISFSGNSSTSDEVLRREMRQLEGAPVSTKNLEQSKLRLERLGLFGDIELDTKEVPGTIDQVDVEFTVTEQPTASVKFSLGYSGDGGVTLGAGLQHNNWLGTGNTFGFNIEKSDFITSYNLNYNNPYFTVDGVSRGINLFFRERDYDEISVSNYTTDTAGGQINFGYPLSETSRLSLGVGGQNIKVQAGTQTPQEILASPNLLNIDNTNLIQAAVPNDFYIDNLSSVDIDDLIIANDDLTFFTASSDIVSQQEDGFLDKYGDSFSFFSLDLGWGDSKLNRGIFPTAGTSQRFNFEVALPGGDIEYYKMNYQSELYIPIRSQATFHLQGRLGYGDGYGNLEELPFFENFFSGGIGSVRGFESSSLGPKGTPAQGYALTRVRIDGAEDINTAYVLGTDGQLLASTFGSRDSFGGNVLLELSAELVMPIPFVKANNKARMTLFVDAGNVFSTACGPLQENCDNLDIGNLSIAAGIGFQWLSPVGPLSFNFSRAISEQPFDQPEAFQFSLGRSF